MKKLFALWSVFMAVFLIVPSGCSINKNSEEACIHQASLDLDKGNYDAVLSSSCADSMQLGAAWFGKAGFDMTTVINELITANSSSSSQSDLSIYMTALVSDVTTTTMTDLDNALASYGSVTSSSDSYEDAQFYISLVDAMKSLSLIKAVLGTNTIDANGNLNTACDDNGNGVPDGADATSCELIAVTNINSGVTTTSCSPVPFATYAPSTPAPITTLTDITTGQTYTGTTFSGLTVTLSSSGTGTTSGCSPAGNTTYTYKRLLYQDLSGNWWAATTTTDTCTDGTNQWPCPMVGPNLDLASAINTSINASISSLNTSLTTTTPTDVQQSLNTLQTQACTAPCSSVCPPLGTSCPSTCTAPYDMTYCSSQSIANYIQTL